MSSRQHIQNLLHPLPSLLGLRLIQPPLGKSIPNNPRHLLLLQIDSANLRKFLRPLNRPIRPLGPDAFAPHTQQKILHRAAGGFEVLPLLHLPIRTRRGSRPRISDDDPMRNLRPGHERSLGGISASAPRLAVPPHPFPQLHHFPHRLPPQLDEPPRLRPPPIRRGDGAFHRPPQDGVVHLRGVEAMDRPPALDEVLELQRRLLGGVHGPGVPGEEFVEGDAAAVVDVEVLEEGAGFVGGGVDVEGSEHGVEVSLEDGGGLGGGGGGVAVFDALGVGQEDFAGVGFEGGEVEAVVDAVDQVRRGGVVVEVVVSAVAAFVLSVVVVVVEVAVIADVIREIRLVVLELRLGLRFGAHHLVQGVARRLADAAVVVTR
mmetsp:Transcript_19561/g.40980  ORF Transcript_19561/g.40980 Transcript_19561/m.40980 type:complete len:374 (-) Transcript_19561:281-1402(-)